MHDYLYVAARKELSTREDQIIHSFSFIDPQK